MDFLWDMFDNKNENITTTVERALTWTDRNNSIPSIERSPTWKASNKKKDRSRKFRTTKDNRHGTLNDTVDRGGDDEFPDYNILSSAYDMMQRSLTSFSMFSVNTDSVDFHETENNHMQNYSRRRTRRYDSSSNSRGQMRRNRSEKLNDYVRDFQEDVAILSNKTSQIDNIPSLLSEDNDDQVSSTSKNNSDNFFPEEGREVSHDDDDLRPTWNKIMSITSKTRKRSSDARGIFEPTITEQDDEGNIKMRSSSGDNMVAQKESFDEVYSIKLERKPSFMETVSRAIPDKLPMLRIRSSDIEEPPPIPLVPRQSLQVIRKHSASNKHVDLAMDADFIMNEHPQLPPPPRSAKKSSSSAPTVVPPLPTEIICTTDSSKRDIDLGMSMDCVKDRNTSLLHPLSKPLPSPPTTMPPQPPQIICINASNRHEDLEMNVDFVRHHHPPLHPPHSNTSLPSPPTTVPPPPPPPEIIDNMDLTKRQSSYSRSEASPSPHTLLPSSSPQIIHNDDPNRYVDTAINVQDVVTKQSSSSSPQHTAPLSPQYDDDTLIYCKPTTDQQSNKKKRLKLAIFLIIVLLIIAIVIGSVKGKQNSISTTSQASSTESKNPTGQLDGTNNVTVIFNSSLSSSLTTSLSDYPSSFPTTIPLEYKPTTTTTPPTNNAKGIGRQQPVTLPSMVNDITKNEPTFSPTTLPTKHVITSMMPSDNPSEDYYYDYYYYYRVTNIPTPSPTKRPSPLPTRRLTPRPTWRPTPRPTRRPSPSPTRRPSPLPTKKPSPSPTRIPSPSPTRIPSPSPTRRPSPRPTRRPNPSPTNKPSPSPTNKPSPSPTNKPSPSPTNKPSPSPTNKPSPSPTNKPSPSPTNKPSPSPTKNPSPSPTKNPSPLPTMRPSPSPTKRPSPRPTRRPTPRPTKKPTPRPTWRPIPSPTRTPTPRPTRKPTSRPTNRPTPSPTNIPSPSPTNKKNTPKPTVSPTRQKTTQPTTLSPTDITPLRTEVTFYAMGGIPYDPTDITKLETDIANIPPDDAATFVIHLGDIMNARTSYCMRRSYADVQTALKTSPLPVFIIPGDNDWTKCPVPDVAWKKWQAHFDQFDNFWTFDKSSSLTVHRQAKRTENFSFFYNGVLFIGIHLVNGFDHDFYELDARLADNLAWTKVNMGYYAVTMRSVVVFGHSAMIGDTSKDSSSALYRNFFRKFINNVNALGKPTLYLHVADGEDDGWREYGVSESKLLVAAQVEMGHAASPVKVRVGTDDDAPFIFERS